MNSLNKFQKNCEQSLNDSVLLLNKEICNRTLDGENEVFINANISDTDIEFWIYENETMFMGKDIEFHFEEPDYQNEEKLITDFVETITLYIKGTVPKEAGSGFVKLFTGKKL